MKEQDKSPGTDPNEVEFYDLPDRKLKIMDMKMITEVKTAVQEKTENF